LNKHLPGNFKQQADWIMKLIERIRTKGVSSSFPYIFFPDFIEQFGLQDIRTSLHAMEQITQFVSCEFAIRPFLLNDRELVMKQMLTWSRHPSEHVRRFASEGCRPRLPWAVAIPQFKKDPSPILPILENLKSDESLFVRKSVANNLNDIAKDNPKIVMQLAKKWKGTSKETDWIIKHGSRTLLKKADPAAYQLFGLNGGVDCVVSNLKLNKARLRIGDQLNFSFDLDTKSKKNGRLRIEYVIYYVKSSGRQHKKLFKLAENSYEPGTHKFNRMQRFQDFTTRKYYPGKHKIGIVVNGKELATKEFTLM
jgi:3-methyladenine DNA glycosylase AlkC